MKQMTKVEVRAKYTCPACEVNYDYLHHLINGTVTDEITESYIASGKLVSHSNDVKCLCSTFRHRRR